MAKHNRDQALDFQGFLNDLQDWEFSIKDRDKKVKHKASSKDNLVSSSQKLDEKLRPRGNVPLVESYSTNYDPVSHISSSLMHEESFPDATSEKELGNEYFKQKKFKEAIDCYSRSIGLSPTAVAYANRAMAYIKLKRFQEAEDDCTEALNLDDRYMKAYLRRATARKELGKLKESIEDSQLVLRLEPQNQEMKKQLAEVKSLYEKEILQKASKTVQKVGKSGMKVNAHEVRAGPVSTKRTVVTEIQGHAKEKDSENRLRTSLSTEKTENKRTTDGSKNEGQRDSSGAIVTQSPGLEKINRRTRKHELNESVEELAIRAASIAVAEAAKNITPPKSAYEFEVSWRGFSGDRALQSRLLKAISPAALPQIFKNALSAPVVIDIVKVVATFFIDEMDLAIKYLENLTKVPRFDLLIMCLSLVDKADLRRVWDETFSNEAIPIEYSEILDNLRSKYCLNQ